jgi:DNA repair protein RecO (recombination protein O)
VKQLLTKGIILSRTDYGEADRILTILTPEQGKLRLMARSVRKPKSKLAGGIELFSTTDLTYMNGRGEIGTLISSRLVKYYSTIVKDIDRVQLGYELIKTLHRATEDQPEPDYFNLLEQAFQALDDAQVGTDLIRLWFESRLLYLAGHSPNLRTDTAGQKLTPDQTYNFDFEAMAFTPHASGNFKAAHIKTLRLLFSHHQPKALNQVEGLNALLPDLTPLIRTMLTSYIRI